VSNVDEPAGHREAHRAETEEGGAAHVNITLEDLSIAMLPG
jgi:hypothetical protein